jgi:sigma-B regulation protein RsbU (phosphoserine phosphatase)
MVRALNINSKDTAKELLGNMRHAVDGFVQNAPQFDDLTMLCLEYKGPVDK